MLRWEFLAVVAALAAISIIVVTRADQQVTLVVGVVIGYACCHDRWVRAIRRVRK